MARERQRGERGLDQALARLETADAAQDEDGALIALVEAVAWVTALDDWLLGNVPGTRTSAATPRHQVKS